jgi:beta-lactamase class A
MQASPPQSNANSESQSQALKAEAQTIVDNAVRKTLAQFAPQKLAPDQLAVTLIDLSDPARPAQGSYRGGERMYPASVIKMFYLVAAHAWMEESRLQDSPELRRAMRDMIVDSLNEATGLVVDSLTGTTSGPELPDEELQAWYDKRNAVNRYFASLGYVNINVNRKPWCEGPYGREMQSVQQHRPNHRNWLTTDATARLFLDIVTGRAVSAKRSAEMMELLRRDPFAPIVHKDEQDDQAHSYTGRAVPTGAKLWSKAGWMSEVRHDAAYVELAEGPRFVLITFTAGHVTRPEIIPTIARAVIEGMVSARVDSR